MISHRPLIILCLGAFLFACSAKLAGNEQVLKTKDGNTYTLKVMADGKMWMTQNLNMDIQGSFCYDDKDAHCAKYGRLYTWEAAKKACELTGRKWRLPSNEAWEEMIQHYGGVRIESKQDGKEAYKRLIQGGDAQFNIVFGGNRDPSGEYRRIEAHGFYWTATAYDSASAWLYNLGKNGQFVNRHQDSEKSRAVSVRCVRD